MTEAETLINKKKRGEKITALAVYDACMASLVDACGIDILLVGDSLGPVMLGYGATTEVTMEDMLHHVRAVARGAENALVVADMPIGTYLGSKGKTLTNAERFVEAGAGAVKLEGGTETAPFAADLVSNGIPVMGHVGLTPQTAEKLGGFKVQGRNAESAKRIIEGAKSLESAGVFSVVLECVPASLAKDVTSQINVPTIGIGAGPHTDGQILVSYDMLGIYEKGKFKFVRKYAGLADDIKKAVSDYKADVLSGRFPAEKESFR